MLRIETPEFCATKCDFSTMCSAARLAVSLEKIPLRSDEETTEKTIRETKAVEVAMANCALDLQHGISDIMLDDQHIMWGTKTETRIAGLQRAAICALADSK